MKFSKENFYLATKATWSSMTVANVTDRKPDYVSEARDLNGGPPHKSEYWFTEAGVYRRSDHWGRVSYCQWEHKEARPARERRTITGFCAWSQFKDNAYKQHSGSTEETKLAALDHITKFYRANPEGQAYLDARFIQKAPAERMADNIRKKLRR